MNFSISKNLSVLIIIFLGLGCDDSSIDLAYLLTKEEWTEYNSNDINSEYIPLIRSIKFNDDKLADFEITIPKVSVDGTTVDTLKGTTFFSFNNTIIIFPDPIDQILVIEGNDSTLTNRYLSPWEIIEYREDQIKFNTIQSDLTEGLFIGFRSPTYLMPNNKATM